MTDYSKNPLIESHPADTVYLCKCAIGALARVHADRADHDTDGMTPDHTRGVGMLLECIESALRHAYANFDKAFSTSGDAGRPGLVDRE